MEVCLSGVVWLWFASHVFSINREVLGCSVLSLDVIFCALWHVFRMRRKRKVKNELRLFISCILCIFSVGMENG